MSVFETVAVVEFLIEPLKSLNFFRLRLEHFAFIVDLSQLFVFHLL